MAAINWNHYGCGYSEFYLNNNFWLMLAFSSEHSFKAEPLQISSSGSNRPLGTCSEHKRPRATLPNPGLLESCSFVPTATQFTHRGGSLSHPIPEASVLLFRWAFLASLCTPQESLNIIPLLLTQDNLPQCWISELASPWCCRPVSRWGAFGRQNSLNTPIYAAHPPDSAMQYSWHS